VIERYGRDEQSRARQGNRMVRRGIAVRTGSEERKLQEDKSKRERTERAKSAEGKGCGKEGKGKVGEKGMKHSKQGEQSPKLLPMTVPFVGAHLGSMRSCISHLWASNLIRR
jgi:hypothetical protein